MNRHKKEIALLLAALAVLGISLFSMMRKSTPPPAKKETPPDAQAAGTAAQQARAAEEEPEGPLPQTGSASRNPFEAVAGAPPGPPSASGEAAGPEGQQPAARPPAAPAGALGASPAAPQGIPGEEATPTITLTGIITGQPSVAVIYHGDQRRYARVGDRIGDYRVQTIGRQEVVLVGPTGKLILRMGGRQ
jgi:hypothetical protein